MSDLVVQEQSIPTKAKGRKPRSTAIQVKPTTVESIQTAELIEREDTRFTDSQALELIKSALGKDLASLSEDESYALSLQSQSVRDFVAQAAEIRDMKVAQRNQIISQVAEMIRVSNQWLKNTVESQKVHYAELSRRSSALSAEDLLKSITGCDSIEEYLSGGDLPGESDISESYEPSLIG